MPRLLPAAPGSGQGGGVPVADPRPRRDLARSRAGTRRGNHGQDLAVSPPQRPRRAGAAVYPRLTVADAPPGGRGRPQARPATWGAARSRAAPTPTAPAAGGPAA